MFLTFAILCDRKLYVHTGGKLYPLNVHIVFLHIFKLFNPYGALNMSTKLHKNATPNTVFTGINDTLLPGAAIAPLALANHTLLNFVNSGWGDYDKPILTSNGNDASHWFGDRVFDATGPFYNYQSVLSEAIMGKATPQFMWRVNTGGGARSHGRLYIEYVEAEIENFERLPSGQFKRTVAGTDANGKKIIGGKLIPHATHPKISGYNVRYIWDTDNAIKALGDGVEAAGSLKGKPNATSVILPIMDTQGRWEGTLANRIGTKLFAPKQTDLIPANFDSVLDGTAGLFRFGMTMVAPHMTTPRPLTSLENNDYIDFTTIPNRVNKHGVPIDFDFVYDKAYNRRGQATTGSNREAMLSTYMYDENIAKVSELLFTAESKHIKASGEMAGLGMTAKTFNILDGTDCRKIPYFTVSHVKLSAQYTKGQVLLNEDSVLRLAGGKDPVADDKLYNAQVRYLAKNIQKIIPVKDIMQYPFHWVYDMGFEHSTTLALYNIMAQRADVIVVGATHEHGVAPKSTADETATALDIATAASLYPESVLYKTPATRGAIMPYSMRLNNHKYRLPISANFEVAMKMNDYLGRSDLTWVVDKDPMLPKNKAFEHTLLNYKAEGLDARSTMWANQMIAIETVSHETIGLSGLQTINPNDTSVLNSLLVTAAAIQATHAAGEACVINRGRTDYPENIAKDHIELINERCKGIDTSKATIAPRVYQTKDDKLDGYSMTTEIDLEGGSMITANTVTVNSKHFL